MLPRLDLAEHLHDDRCLAAAGISDDLEVLIFGAFRNAQKIPALVHLDSDSGSLDGLVELFRRDQNWPLETAPILHFFPPADVLRNRPGELDQEEDSSKDELKSEHPREGLAVVDLLLQITFNADPRERRPARCERERPCLFAEPNRTIEAESACRRLWSRARFDIHVSRVPGMTFCYPTSAASGTWCGSGRMP